MNKNIVVLINTSKHCYRLLHRTELRAINECMNQWLLKDGDALITYTISDDMLMTTKYELNEKGNQFLK